MPKQFDGKQCVFGCGRGSSASGEHVWPRWLLKMFPPSEGPYTTFVNGAPVRKRDGSVRHRTSFGAVKVPMCAPCNGNLERRFEKPAKPILRRLFEANGAIDFTAKESGVLGLWFLKTWLLLAHPCVTDPDSGLPSIAWDETPHGLFEWMVLDKAPPDGLSLWGRRRLEERREKRPKTEYLALPTIVADGREVVYRVLRAGLRFLDINLVYHPGWEIEHPLESDGRALRLWPTDATSIGARFSTLPETDTREFDWLEGAMRVHFAPGHFGAVDLPPLTSGFDLLSPGQLMVPGVQMVEG